jgi:DNA repair exonuclease SbcCD nuclease subunit
MKFILVSDVHLLSKNPVARIDNLVEAQVAKLECVLRLAEQEQMVILQAGDLFDKPRSWTTLEIATRLLRRYNAIMMNVYGQHDTYMYSDETRGRTSLGVLANAGLIHLLCDTPWNPEAGVSVYGANYGHYLPAPERSTFNVGVIHAGISDAPLWPGHEYTHADKYLAANYGYDLILCGDIHRKFEVWDGGRLLVNTGPMLRKEASEYNMGHMPQVAIFDTVTRKLEWVSLPAEPARAVLSREHIERRDDAEDLLDEFVAKIKSDTKEKSGVSFIENLWKFVSDNEIDKDVVDVLARTVGKAIREEL